jgi:hypothetical protein
VSDWLVAGRVALEQDTRGNDELHVS